MTVIGRTGLVTCAALTLWVWQASAQETWVDGHTAQVEFRRPTRVGPTLLAPGTYQLQHQVIDGQDYLAVHVASRSFVPGHHYLGAVIEEVARVPCRIIPTRAEQADTAVYTKRDAEDVAIVTRVAMRGEKGIHVITTLPPP